jgi:hypothetical protein
MLSSYSFIVHYIFQPNWPSSSVQVVVKDSAAHCNAVFFPPTVVASGYFGYVGSTWLLLVLFGLLVVAALTVLAEAGFLLCVGRPSQIEWCSIFNYIFISSSNGLFIIKNCSVPLLSRLHSTKW